MRKCTPVLVSFLFALHVFAQPTIQSFSPTSAAVGSSVIITGRGFDTIPINNIVYFGAVKASVVGATDSTLTAIVPSGGTYQPISVTENHLTAYSSNPFIVTFSSGGDTIGMTSFMPKLDFGSGNYPHSVAFADFNGDGKIDLLTCKGSSSTVSVFTNTSSNGTISFGTKSEFTATGNNHEGCAVADLDGDGKLDFIITNSTGLNSISVYRNASNGGTVAFAGRVDFAVDNAPYSVSIGDLNGDGKPDVVVGNNGSNVISVFINKSTPGTISFSARTDYNVGTNPYGVAIGDLDGDGKPDLVVTTQGSTSSLTAMRNLTTSGDSLSFDLPVNFATVPGPFTVSISDLDGDGKPELIAASSGAGIFVINNTSVPGTISFGALEVLPAGNYTECVAIGDVDGDGKPDLITANNFSNNVSVLKNNSTIGNVSFAKHVDYAVDANPIYLAAGDIDGDGRLDIAVANSSSDSVSVLKNIIGANLAPVINSFTPTSGINGTVVKIGGSNFTGTTAVRFGGVNASSFSVDSSSGITAVVGVGGTGDVSVTTKYGTASKPGFVFNGPVITSFSPTVGIAGTIVTITGYNFNNVTAVSFGGISASSFTVNSFTTITAVVGSGSNGSVTVTTPNGTALLAGFSFGPPAILSFTPTSGQVGSTVTITGRNFSSISSGNIVYFGAVKATVIADSSNSPSQLKVLVPPGAIYQPISITTNNLTAYSSLPFLPTFPLDSVPLSANSFSIAANYPAGNYPTVISISDLDGDGKSDLITANNNSNNISILRNTSTGSTISFGSKTDYATGADPKGIAIGDLDGDGKPDVAVVNSNSGNASTMSVFRNTSVGGSISFAAKADYNTGNGTLGIAIADMDGDGKPDIVVTSGNSGVFSFYKNVSSPGSISFAQRVDFSTTGHADNLIIADIDGDGRPDLITSNFSASSISVYQNTSLGGVLSLASKVDYLVGSNPGYLTTGDFEGDGKLDVIVENYGSKNISLLKNASTPGSISLIDNGVYPLAATNLTAADLNGDGKPDLCSGIGLTGVIALLPNSYNGNGILSFGTNVSIITGNYDTYVSAGDLNNDGYPDIAVVNTTLNTITIIKRNGPLPKIDSITSVSGRSDSSVTLKGSNFNGATAVNFGGTPAQSFTVVSSSRIDATVGRGSSGNVTVTTSFGTATIGNFSFIPAVSAGGPVAFCKNSSVTLRSTAANGNQWYKDGAAINGAALDSLVVVASGTYMVKTTSNGITTSSDSSIAVTVSTAPAPTISVDANGKLVSSASTGNQWYLNGNLITDANAKTYLPQQGGIYTVKDTLNGCVSDFSPGYNLVITGIVSLGNNQFIKLYPNPIQRQLNTNWNINGVVSLNVELTDLYGRKISEYIDRQSGSSIDVSLLPSGIYFVRLYSNNGKVNVTMRIMK